MVYDSQARFHIRIRDTKVNNRNKASYERECPESKRIVMLFHFRIINHTRSYECKSHVEWIFVDVTAAARTPSGNSEQIYMSEKNFKYGSRSYRYPQISLCWPLVTIPSRTEFALTFRRKFR